MIYGAMTAVSVLLAAAAVGAVVLAWRCEKLRVELERVTVERNGLNSEVNRLTERIGEARREAGGWRAEAEHAQREATKLRKSVEVLRDEYRKLIEADDRARRELSNFWGYSGDDSGQEDLTDG